MSILGKIFKKHETHLPDMPAEYREDYQNHMARKGVDVSPPEDKIPDYGVYGTDEPLQAEPVVPVTQVEPVDMNMFDMPAPVQESVTIDSINERLTKLENILKEKGLL